MRPALIAFALVLAACGARNEGVPPPPEDRPVGSGAAAGTGAAPAATAPAAVEARQIYGARCATCHGAGGRGDGAAAATMRPPPRDYTDAAWQASVSDADLVKIIVAGGAALGKSPMMPAGQDLARKPEVVAELVMIIRGFAAAK